ncbi:MAG: hypothetical protein MMC23_006526 [Stictis urceolatum]|nr:hypothetical protein [Stictis urceolata]
MPTSTRRTRFVCLSDTHNASPRNAFKLPKGDVLIHAGDLTKNGTPAELQNALSWISQADFQLKLVTAGNHDVALDPSSASDAFPFPVSSHPPITYLAHSSAHITLPSSPSTTFHVFASPYSPSPLPPPHEPHASHNFSAFQYPLSENPWSIIPLDTDILITHTPPFSHRDQGRGCAQLQKALGRVRPRLLVCGHVHEGRGAEKIEWEIDETEGLVRAGRVERWVDLSEGSKRDAKVDLRKGRGREGEWVCERGRVIGADEGEREGKEREWVDAGGRLDRLETVVINAAIMATSWPYRKGEGRFNKPIVVDLDLPVVGEDDDGAGGKGHSSGGLGD